MDPNSTITDSPTPTEHPSQPSTSTDISCFQCGSAVMPSHLASHIRRRHPDLVLSHERLQQLGLVACPECRQFFSASRGLAAHIRTCRRVRLPQQSQDIEQTQHSLAPSPDGNETQSQESATQAARPPEVPRGSTFTPAPAVTLPTSNAPPPVTPVETCMNCDEPSISWPCCGSSTMCIGCTRQARNSVPQESCHFPHPRCPSCRADYPRDYEFTLRFCRVCTQPTEPLPDFATRTGGDNGVTQTYRQPTVRAVNEDWITADCCGGRVHLACLSSLAVRGQCPLCVRDHCSDCHFDCNAEMCRPRPRTEPPSENTVYDRCQNPPYHHRECGHAACPLHFALPACRACTNPPSPGAAALVPPESPDRPASPAHSEGDYPGPFPYGNDHLTACDCGGIRNLFECDTCGPQPVPAGDMDIHVTDLFAALHDNHDFFLDAMLGRSNGALNAVSRFSSICPSCGAAACKTNPGRPACDAMLCTMCHTHFCFYCEARIPDNYNLPGHGPHYGNHQFAARPAAVRNGWCRARNQAPLATTIRPPLPPVAPLSQLHEWNGDETKTEDGLGVSVTAPIEGPPPDAPEATSPHATSWATSSTCHSLIVHRCLHQQRLDLFSPRSLDHHHSGQERHLPQSLSAQRRSPTLSCLTREKPCPRPRQPFILS
jgi:hypothetical protein